MFNIFFCHLTDYGKSVCTFFYKNKLYKDIHPEKPPKIKDILRIWWNLADINYKKL